MVRPLKCQICNKTVGWAESVHRDEQVFHRDCFRCSGCKKKLDRGSGLRDKGGYFCNNCHGKQFGPMGFKKGVVKSKEVMTRVTMNMQPPFAHVVADSPKHHTAPVKTTQLVEQKDESSKEAQRLHEFDVAVFQGDSVIDLKAYLEHGNLDLSSWPEETFEELLDHIKVGKCQLGLDTDGNALRVASVAKVFIFDETNDLLLFNPLNSFEEEDFVTRTKSAQTKDLELLLKVVGDVDSISPKNAFENQMYRGVLDTLYSKEQKSGGSIKQTPVEIPGAFVFETTFSPFDETPREAAARVFGWRFGLKSVSGRVFEKLVPSAKRTYGSTHYPNLNSEYHIHHVMLRSEYVAPVQKILHAKEVSPLCLDEVTNTGVNTHWYAWLKPSHTLPEDIVKELREVYASNEKVQKLVGNVDFAGPMALAMGKMLVNEASLLKLWN